MAYRHTQTAPLYLILVGVGTAILLAAHSTSEMTVRLILLSSAGVMFLLALCFQQLTVADQGQRLLISFGPLPLFRRSVRYADIQRVERGRSTILDGWGIHLSPRGGWTWNLWGFECLEVYFKNGRVLRIGTDDLLRLETFVRQRVSHEQRTAVT